MTMYDRPDWTLMVERGESVNTVRIGIFYDDNLPAYVGGPNNGVGFFLELIAQNAARRAMEGPGTSRYLYFSESKDHTRLSDTINYNQLSMNQRADEFEIKMSAGKKILFKAYTAFKGSLVGIYKINDKLVFVRF